MERYFEFWWISNLAGLLGLVGCAGVAGVVELYCWVITGKGCDKRYFATTVLRHGYVEAMHDLNVVLPAVKAIHLELFVQNHELRRQRAELGVCKDKLEAILTAVEEYTPYVGKSTKKADSAWLEVKKAVLQYKRHLAHIAEPADSPVPCGCARKGAAC